MLRFVPFLYYMMIVSLIALHMSEVLAVESDLTRLLIPTVVDRAVPFLRRGELKRMLGLDNSNRRNQHLAVENVHYKCQILTALYSYWKLTFRASSEKNGMSSRISNLLRDCRSPDFQLAEFFNQTTIFPGTKWCGQSNLAEDYDDLGFFNETDSCCREHDMCDDIIQPGKSKHNLINPYSTTRLNCECDETLRRCFLNVNSVISNTMGYVFFSMLQTQCFKLEYPALGCELWRPGSVRLYCVRYKLDKNQPKKWQWFDQEPYF